MHFSQWQPSVGYHSMPLLGWLLGKSYPGISHGTHFSIIILNTDYNNHATHSRVFATSVWSMARLRPLVFICNHYTLAIDHPRISKFASCSWWGRVCCRFSCQRMSNRDGLNLVRTHPSNSFSYSISSLHTSYIVHLWFSVSKFSVLIPFLSNNLPQTFHPRRWALLFTVLHTLSWLLPYLVPFLIRTFSTNQVLEHI